MKSLTLTQWMLWSPMRQYVMDKIKAPLMDAICALARRYPPPLRDTVEHPNALILLDIEDKFFQYEDNPGRTRLFEAIWRIFIVEYEHDRYYRQRIDWILREINKSGWVTEPTECPQDCWKEKR